MTLYLFQIIDMSGHNITDKAFSLLVQIPSLERVDAYFTSVTQEGITAFKQQLKRDCEVNFETPYLPAATQPVLPMSGAAVLENNNGEVANIPVDADHVVIHADLFRRDIPNQNQVEENVGNRIIHVHYVPPLETDSDSDAEVVP